MNRFNYEAEPFQGFTEFDEFGTLDEFDEFGTLDEFGSLDELGSLEEFELSDEFGEYGEGEYADPELFEADFEMEPEGEMSRRRQLRGPSSPRRPAPRGQSRARRPVMRRPRQPGMRASARPQRPMRSQRPTRRTPARPARRTSARPTRRTPTRPGGASARSSRGMPAGRPRRGRGPSVLGGWPAGAFPVYAGRFVHYHPSDTVTYYPSDSLTYQPSDSGAGANAYGGEVVPVGRVGNWFKSGDRIVILLDEDDEPLDSPENDDAPAANDSQSANSQGELSGQRFRPDRKIARVQDALNYLRGLRLPLNGLLDTKTRSSLRVYQNEKGLETSGQPDYETELSLARDILNIQQNYEYEGPEIDPCGRRCEEIFNRCIKLSTSPLSCLARRGTCLMICAHKQQPHAPRPPAPRPPAPKPPCPSRPTLSYGSKGSAVKELQTRLNANGATPPLKVDGDFGPLTNGAVLSFQRSRGLVVDGIVGPKTWAALGC